MSTLPYLKWLHEVELSDIPTVGGKNASLGEMIQNLGKLGVQVPGGFVVTVASYEAFIAHNVLDQKIRDIVAGLDVDDVENIRRTGLAVRTLDLAEKTQADFAKRLGHRLSKRIPIILFDKEYWQPFVDLFYQMLVKTEKTINKDDLDLFVICDTPDEAYEKIMHLVKC